MLALLVGIILPCSLIAESNSELVKLSKSACLAGEKLDVRIDAKGDIALFKKSLGNLEGAVRINKQEIHGAIGLETEGSILVENSEIRSCVLKVITMLRRVETLPISRDNQSTFLSNDQVIINNYNSPTTSHQKKTLRETNSDFGKIKLKMESNSIKPYHSLSEIKINKESNDDFGRIIERKSSQLIPFEEKF